MAKKEKAEKANSKAEKAQEREFKYGVEDLADALSLKPASVRMKLRNKGIDKAGKAYGWNSKAELQEVIAQLKSEEDEKPAKKAEKKEKKAEKKEKPSKKAEKAKPTKKAKSKKPRDEEDEDDDD